MQLSTISGVLNSIMVIWSFYRNFYNRLAEILIQQRLRHICVIWWACIRTPKTTEKNQNWWEVFVRTYQKTLMQEQIGQIVQLFKRFGNQIKWNFNKQKNNKNYNNFGYKIWKYFHETHYITVIKAAVEAVGRYVFSDYSFECPLIT